MAIKVTGNIVITDAQAIANITTISANGNANVGNLGTAQVLATANITAPQLISNVTTGTAPIVVTSTTVVANLNANALQGNVPSATAVANTIVQRNVDGNITANFYIGNGSQLTGISGGLPISNGTSNINIPASGGNINFSVGGSANEAIVTSTGFVVNGSIDATGNITVPVLISNIATGTAPLTVSSTTRVANLNVAYANVADLINVADVTTGTFYPMLANAATGNVAEGSNANLTFNAATGALNATLLGGTLTTAAQPNITSVGTLSGLTVSATISGSVSGSAATFTSTSQNSQFNSVGVGTAASTTAGEIRATNNITAYFSSDKRLKENIKNIENSLELVKKIRGVNFDWTQDYINKNGGEDGYFIRKNDVGVIAQEVQAVLPQVVAKRSDDYLAVRYEKIIPLLIEAIKELSETIDELKRERN